MPACPRASSISSPGSDRTLGRRLVEHPRRPRRFVYRIVGGGPHGRTDRCRHFKPCSLEMGGKNAMIVLEDANLDLALDGALWGAFGTTGQRCTATSRIIVHRDVAKRVHREAGRARAKTSRSATASMKPCRWARRSTARRSRPPSATARSRRRKARKS